MDNIEDGEEIPLIGMEAANGFEPLNGGFADHCLTMGKTDQKNI